MASFFTTAAFGALLLASQATAACTSNLLIDNFANFSQRTNTLGGRASDDATMRIINASGNTLTYIPNPNSYFYENMPCNNASAEGYTGVSFDIRGSGASQFVAELQTLDSCASTTRKSAFTLVQNITDQRQTITLPFSRFAGANTNAVSSVVFTTFNTSQIWQLSNVQLVCGGSATPAPRPAAAPQKRQQCQNLLIEDFESQSRLTFTNYNSLYRSTSDDGSLQSPPVVGSPARHRATFTPKGDSYWYSSFDCVDARNKYGGISLRIKAPRGSSFSVTMQSSSSCSTEQNLKEVTQTASQLGWTFDGTEKLYSLPFSKFSGLGTGNLVAFLISGLNNPVSLGPISFYCGTTVSEYTPPAVVQPATPSGTVPVTTATASALVIDTFANRDSNSLGFWHGPDEGLAVTWGSNRVTINPNSADLAFYTEMTNSCRDVRQFDGGYLHIAFSGSSAFSVAMLQHNSKCDTQIQPYPETWESIEASRYVTSTGNIYIPMTHFNINRQRIIGLSFKGFYTTASTTLTRVEIVKTVPSGTRVPEKVPTSQLVFACTRPNSFAFAIDDGVPELAQEVMSIIRQENFKVTFFTVGAPLLDPGTNFSNVYNEMKNDGHQIALHSFTHPPMEGLASNYDIDWELDNDIKAVQQQLGITGEKYFRPPFGTEGARMRQRTAAKLGSDAKTVMWSVDIEDYLWADSDTPEKQVDAFRRDVNKGGNLVVMHYLTPNTVKYVRDFIQIAKSTGKQLMRVDQCMQDPNAPPL